jgi:uncharacterized protein YggE
MSGPNEDSSARATIDVRTLVIVIAVAVALLGAYAVGTAGGDASTRAAADTGEGDSSDPADTPTIVMTGTGKATPVSDQMTFRVRIHAVRSDVSSAMTTVGTKATRVLHALRGVGVDPTYVKTTGLSVRPQYDYFGTGPAVISGYTASQSLEVAVRDLQNGGTALAVTAEAGGNEVRISGVKLGVADPDEARAQARKDAIDEASAKAEEYAAAAGRELGDVISVREVMPGTYIPPTPYADTSALRAAAYGEPTIPVPIRAGRSSNSVTVAVVWEFAQ